MGIEKLHSTNLENEKFSFLNILFTPVGHSSLVCVLTYKHDTYACDLSLT